MNGSAITARTNIKIAAELLHALAKAAAPYSQLNRVVMASSMDQQGVWAAGPMTGGQRVTPHPS